MKNFEKERKIRELWLIFIDPCYEFELHLKICWKKEESMERIKHTWREERDITSEKMRGKWFGNERDAIF